MVVPATVRLRPAPTTRLKSLLRKRIRHWQDTARQVLLAESPAGRDD